MSYRAPLVDLRFVLYELVDFAGLRDMPAFQEFTPDVIDAVLNEAAKFAGTVLSPINHSGDRAGAVWKAGQVTTAPYFKEAFQQFVEAGWMGLPANPVYGGQGFPALVASAVAEMWKSANLAFSLCPLLTQSAIAALDHYASEALKQCYLPPLIAGEWTATMNLTESQAGSDLAAIRTKAERVGDSYRITGQKIFITWGEHDLSSNIIHLVLARLPDAPAGVKGISLFIVPKYLLDEAGKPSVLNDLRCVSLEHKLGIHASPTAVMSYGDEGGAVGYLVGEENEGLKYMFAMMNHARFAVGLEGVAIAERAYQQAVHYAQGRVQGSLLGDKSGQKVAIVQHADVRRMLLTMKAFTEATRAVAYTTAGLLDMAMVTPDGVGRQAAQARAELLIPVVKGWCTEVGNEVVSLGVQVHGGMGYIEETGAAQYFRDARITTIYEGTTGIQANDLMGRKVAADGGATLKALIVAMQETVEALVDLRGDDLAAIERGLRAGLADLNRATDYILKTYPTDPLAASAGAVPFLMLLGTVVGGWQMARAAVRAMEKLQQGEFVQFHEAKLITARFYADCLLPRSYGYAQAVLQGAPSILGLATTQFICD